MDTWAILAALTILFSSSKIAAHEEKVDDVFSKCFNTSIHGPDPSRPECTKAFIKFAVDMKTIFHFTKDEINYLYSLEREIQGKYINRRQKRAPHLIIRRECRLMGEIQRYRLFLAVNILKRHTSNPNVYDMIAKLHFGDAVDAHAHIGSNFLGWHRVYLIVYETALRRAVPGVSLCFWDTTMEDRLGRDVWHQTAVFSDDFFGNGRGQVVTGPFKNWPMPEIYRDDLNATFLPRSLNTAGSPANVRAVDLIFYGSNSLSHAQVTPLGEGRDEIIVDGNSRLVTIEGEHNNVHNWMGGAMWWTNTAPQDPVFYLHHTYIDYMWEMFRRKMKRFGRDPSSDYPELGDNAPLHAADYPMIGFESFRNIDGYSDFFTQYVFQNESPSCQACYLSPWTICNKFGKCVARRNMPGTEVVEGPEPRAPATALASRAFRAGGAPSSLGRRFPLAEDTL